MPIVNKKFHIKFNQTKFTLRVSQVGHKIIIYWFYFCDNVFIIPISRQLN